MIKKTFLIEGDKMAKLFSSFTVKNVVLKNRIVMSPMCMYMAENDGFVTPFHITHYASRAIGQVGLIMIEATAVKPEGRITNNDLGIWSDEHIDGLKKITEEISRYGAKSAIQLAHAGRKSETDGEIYAPSAIRYSEDYKMPTEMTKEKIKETVLSFKEGAVRAKKAGFDVIELHGAHGYLINEFLSPLTNTRTDEYGGNLQGRYRFLKEIITNIKEVWDGPLFVRISANEYDPNGNTLEDFIQLAKWMKEDGVDLIDVSTGGVVMAPIPTFPGYQVPYAEAIRKEAGIPTGAVGRITSGIQAEEILQNERADLIFIGRELLRDPYFPLRAANELRAELEVPAPYKRGWILAAKKKK